MSKFKDKVIFIVNKIPYGTVVSYGQVALMAGIPRAARQVGWTLNSLEGNVHLPWWRVINNAGKISIKGSKHSALEQKERLEAEGIKFTGDFELDIEKYRYRPLLEELKEIHLDDDYVSMVLEKYV